MTWLRVAVQMDPLDRINIEGDSTFAIMLGAQARGHSLYHYAAEDLSYAEGRLWTMALAGHGAARRRRPFHGSASPRSSTSAATSTSC